MLSMIVCMRKSNCACFYAKMTKLMCFFYFFYFYLDNYTKFAIDFRIRFLLPDIPPRSVRDNKGTNEVHAELKHAWQHHVEAGIGRGITT